MRITFLASRREQPLFEIGDRRLASVTRDRGQRKCGPCERAV